MDSEGSRRSVDSRVEALLASMTLDEKIGQMTQVQMGSIEPAQVTETLIGSVVSGGGGSPPVNTPAAWAEMTGRYQRAALRTRLAIPVLYAADGVHGHGNLHGATIFPHNIGLGATRNPALVERIGRATALEMVATGVTWNLAPVVAVPQDIRWGRTFEGYAEDPDLVATLAAAFVRGLVAPIAPGSPRALATAKHFVGDGGTLAGTGTYGIRLLDRGDARYDDARLHTLFLPPYQAALAAGAQVVMASHSSWRETKLHAHHHLLTDVLKGELGFRGFVVSDWGALNELPGDAREQVAAAINAGIDMVMVPDEYRRFIDAMHAAVEAGDLPIARIDDAVGRILRAKLESGIFEHPFPDPTLLHAVGSEAHRALAREAVRQSLVLLKNDGPVLPLRKDPGLLLVAGGAADDIGAQCGGWTIQWQGARGPVTPGTSVLAAIRHAVQPGSRVVYDADGRFEEIRTGDGSAKRAEVAVVVLAEDPYAEWFGDTASLALRPADVALVDRVKEVAERVVVILVSGRPLVLTDELPRWDAVVAAWLPGTEGDGVAEVLFGDYPFTGKLPYSWPRSDAEARLPDEPGGRSLFPIGFGLTGSGHEHGSS
jgi:beta-glucosidase